MPSPLIVQALQPAQAASSAALPQLASALQQIATAALSGGQGLEASAMSAVVDVGLDRAFTALDQPLNVSFSPDGSSGNLDSIRAHIQHEIRSSMSHVAEIELTHERRHAARNEWHVDSTPSVFAPLSMPSRQLSAEPDAPARKPFIRL